MTNSLENSGTRKDNHSRSPDKKSNGPDLKLKLSFVKPEEKEEENRKFLSEIRNQLD